MEMVTDHPRGTGRDALHGQLNLLLGTDNGVQAHNVGFLEFEYGGYHLVYLASLGEHLFLVKDLARLVVAVRPVLSPKFPKPQHLQQHAVTAFCWRPLEWVY